MVFAANILHSESTSFTSIGRGAEAPPMADEARRKRSEQQVMRAAAKQDADRNPGDGSDVSSGRSIIPLFPASAEPGADLSGPGGCAGGSDHGGSGRFGQGDGVYGTVG